MNVIRKKSNVALRPSLPLAMSAQDPQADGAVEVERNQGETQLPSEGKGGKRAPGSSWQAEERHVLPKNNLPVVIFALSLAVFLVSS